MEALASGTLDVEDLARKLAVSPSTVRRDLQRLSDEKAILRTYGGAILANHGSETTLDERLSLNGAEKQAIAKEASKLISDGDTIILDAGTTIAALGPLLAGKRLTVVTNNVAILPLLPNTEGLEVITLGGTLRTTSMSTVGPLAFEAMSRLTADRLFTSADGVVADRGLCEGSLDQVALKSLMMRQSRETVVLADASKLGKAERSAWAPLPSKWTIITDSGANEEQVTLCRMSGATIYIADKG